MARLFTGYSTVDIINPGNVRFYDIELVKRDIKNHFMTRKGERLMQPNFGSIIWDLLFDPFEKSTKDLIVNDSKRIIGEEPRVKLLALSVQEYEHGLGLTFLLSFEPNGVTDSLFLAFRRELTPSSSSDFISEDEF